MGKGKVYLDKDRVVGELLPDIDDGLENRRRLEVRGI